MFDLFEDKRAGLGEEEVLLQESNFWPLTRTHMGRLRLICCGSLNASLPKAGWGWRMK